MYLRMMLFVSAAFWSIACGKGDDSNEKDPCSLQADCGGAGEGLCVDEQCIRFSENTAYAKAVMDLSFGRDMYESAASANVYFIHAEAPDGKVLSCSDLLTMDIKGDSAQLNQLTAEPKYMVFNWSHGGTFFPDNLVQLIRPSERALVLVEGYTQLMAKGVISAVGCVDKVVFRAEQTSEFTVQISAP